MHVKVIITNLHVYAKNEVLEYFTLVNKKIFNEVSMSVTKHGCDTALFSHFTPSLLPKYTNFNNCLIVHIEASGDSARNCRSMFALNVLNLVSFRT